VFSSNFISKKKTAKYLGNWDPKAKQPFTYKLQRWILSNTFLTRKMQVLVYGEWEGSNKIIKPFFTATYSESQIQHSVFRTSCYMESSRELLKITLTSLSLTRKMIHNCHFERSRELLKMGLLFIRGIHLIKNRFLLQ
jgi:hypothetical protein